MIERTVPTVAEFLKEDFLRHVETSRNKSKTRIYYQEGTVRLLASNLAKLSLDAITSQHTTRFAHQNRHLAGSTINQALRTLRRALNLAEEWKMLDRAPIVALEEENKRERVLSEEEFNLYLMACGQPWRDVATIMYCLGMRPSEIYTLRWEQISLTENVLQIVNGKTGAARRQLPLVPVVRDIFLTRYREQGGAVDGWVFPSQSKSGHLEQGSSKNQHLRAIHSINETAKKEAKAAGIPNADKIVKLKPFPPYALRHTALTNLAKETDQFSLKAAAGHTSIATTQRYVHPLQKTIQEAFQRMAEKQKLVTVLGTGGKADSREDNPELAANG